MIHCTALIGICMSFLILQRELESGIGEYPVMCTTIERRKMEQHTEVKNKDIISIKVNDQVLDKCIKTPPNAGLSSQK